MVDVAIAVDSRFLLNRARIRAAVAQILANSGVTAHVMVSINVVGDRKMAALNKQYMKRSGTTDVLSFPFQDPASQQEESQGFVEVPDEPLTLGDIVISYPRAVKQAREKNILVDQEIDNLVIHGLEHLLGHHHE